MEYTSSLGQYLASSRYILALVGAGLSAPSGVPTFRGDDATWKARKPRDLATGEAFLQNPWLVWQFYEERRQVAAAALPNPGHSALAKLAEWKGDFLTISQNIDGLLERAGHDLSKLASIHGSLFRITCHEPRCTFTTSNPEPSGLLSPLSAISDTAVDLSPLPANGLPRCPECRIGLLRPGVVWFGEQLPLDILEEVDTWFDSVPRIDLVLVVGTAARVFPAAEYISKAKEKGAYAAHFNLERDEHLISPGDWYIPGDVSTTLPGIISEAMEYSHGVHGPPEDETSGQIFVS